MKITRDDLLIAAFKLFMSVNYEKASFAEFIDEYVNGVQRTMDMLGNLIGIDKDKIVQGKFSYHSQYFNT